MKLETRKRLIELAHDLRATGQTIVLANGCFDLLHAGHLSLLQEAAELGSVLIVAVTCDAEVRRQKGAGRPIVPEADRVACLEAVRWVDYVVVQDDPTPEAIAEILRPDFLVKGAEYRRTDVPGAEHAGEVHFTGMLPGRCTSRIIAQVPAASRG